ncbi:RusA family crossover junction endodeoxyribonuclease [Neopusillimonas aromaticivorans]|uniref:RusA family crossover junction endodeoxyribonuclease n=1 Tax=Neopusillimonas aromaticivorans TaxID=2979868 RepID=UPI0025948425|nr:RusA family crossover junction endodeoxyribonuclease [Neopusillimonas aromaticivorans]WJJ93427.1 RusA family crossover junction endodeoxyribonuclease [Neopusillimonas aromaticivorans]
MITFIVPGKPVGKGRPRAAARGKNITLYTPQKTATYESTVALAADQAMAGKPLITGPVETLMTIVLPVPVSWSKRKQADALAGTVMPTSKPDMDNVVKAIFDAINGIVWTDDVQVVGLRVRKVYGAIPRVQVTVSPYVSQTSGGSL